MTPRELAPRESEIAVIGLARSGRAVATLLRKHGYNVYASDLASSPDTGRCAEELRSQGISVDVGRHDLERLARAGQRDLCLRGALGVVERGPRRSSARDVA